MGGIAVFDSGLGSLSVIGPIRNATNADIVYLADQASYPYGTKTATELGRIIQETLAQLRDRINPDVIVVGSNTPCVMLDDILGGSTIGVLPPLAEAESLSETGSIAVLATRLVTRSQRLAELIYSQLDRSTRCACIDAQDLIDMVESGAFITDSAGCAERIRDSLADRFARDDIDTATLSSTHLPFLRSILEDIFEDIRFVDPAVSVARTVARMTPAGQGSGRLDIYATGDVHVLERKLKMLDIAGPVSAW